MSCDIVALINDEIAIIKIRKQLLMDKWSMRYSVFAAVFCRSSVDFEDIDTTNQLKNKKNRIETNQLLRHG